MAAWRKDIEHAIAAFVMVAELAEDAITQDEISVEFLDAPHLPPTRMPSGKMAVYGFWGDGEWLKIGKAGRSSKARYTSQHYVLNEDKYTFAGSLSDDERMLTVSGFDPLEPGGWILASTHRVNILMPATRRKELLSLLECFLHVRLKPRYEGVRPKEIRAKRPVRSVYRSDLS